MKYFIIKFPVFLVFYATFLMLQIWTGATGFAATSITDSTGFVVLTDVVPDAIMEVRYYTLYNFIGDRVRGYEEPVALVTREAAEALREVNKELLPMGYTIKVFDAYRPDGGRPFRGVGKRCWRCPHAEIFLSRGTKSKSVCTWLHCIPFRSQPGQYGRFNALRFT